MSDCPQVPCVLLEGCVCVAEIYSRWSLFQSPGVLAAVDATVNKALAERYHISGFPTLKYFKDGEEKYTLPHLRTKKKIIDWLQK